MGWKLICNFVVHTFKVIITIEDTNDNPPVFFRAPKVLTVFENVLGARIGELEAKDADLGLNAEIMYSISGGNELGLCVWKTRITVIVVDWRDIIVSLLLLKRNQGRNFQGGKLSSKIS